MDRQRVIYDRRRRTVVMQIAVIPFAVILLVAVVQNVLTRSSLWLVANAVLFLVSAYLSVRWLRLMFGVCYRAELENNTLTIVRIGRSRRIAIEDVSRIRKRASPGGDEFLAIEFIGGEAFLEDDSSGNSFADALMRARPSIATKGWAPKVGSRPDALGADL